jgi:regulator of nucleoside diphosphate kinase
MSNISVPDRVRPRIRLIDTEADIIAQLAIQAEARAPAVAALLLEEVDRADLYGADDIPADVATLGAEIAYRDEASGLTREIRIVLPAHADIAEGKVSILTPVGAGLIGLSAGQTIDWPDAEGRPHRLTILSVRQGAARRAA